MRIVLRFQRARSRLSRYLGLSVGAHCAALVIVAIMPMLRPKAPLIPMDATMVELSGAISTPAPGPASSGRPTPTPPERRPPPEPEGAHAIEKIPEPVKKKDPKPKETKKKEEPPTPPANETPHPGPPGTITSTHEGGSGAGPGPGPGPAAGRTGPLGITSLDAGDPGLSWYNAAVASALENAWVRPVLEGVADVQSVIVAFEIGRDGNVFNLAIDLTSGIASLDRSALRAVQDAAPFPAPPATARGSSVRQRIRFDLRPDSN